MQATKKHIVNKSLPIIFGILLAVVGSALLIASHAATPVAIAEPEAGSLAGGACQQHDNSAAGKTYVLFAASCGPDYSRTFDGVFPYGPFVQPTFLFNTWKARNITALMSVPSGSDINTWANAADAAGLYQVREPRTPTSADKGNKWLWSWHTADEPDAVCGSCAHQSPAQIKALADSWRQVDPTRPTSVNFVGVTKPFPPYDFQQYDKTGTTCGGCGGDRFYGAYAAAVDYISADTYPANMGHGNDLSAIVREVDYLRKLSLAANKPNGKPIFAFIETSDYDTTDANPGPTAGQFRAEMWSAIIHGVNGIWLFSPRVAPDFQWDTTTPAVAAEITRQGATLKDLAPVLNSSFNPASLRASASGLEIGWRVAADGKAYVFALNLSSQAKTNVTINLSGSIAGTAQVYNENRHVALSGNTLTDNFEPFELHIYQM